MLWKTYPLPPPILLKEEGERGIGCRVGRRPVSMAGHVHGQWTMVNRGAYRAYRFDRSRRMDFLIASSSTSRLLTYLCRTLVIRV
jgi:hypothetical protein